MNSEYLTWVKKAILDMAEYYGHKIEDGVLAMYAEDLAELPQPQLQEAFKLLRRDPTVTRFPLPAKIIALVKPPETSKDIASEVAFNLMSAIDKHDYNWDQGWVRAGVKFYTGGNKSHQAWDEAVIAEVGTMGLEVIRRFGGWKKFFDHVVEMDRGTATAQIRDYAQALYNRVKGGRGHEKPALPGSSPAGVVQGLIDNVTRKTGLPEGDG